jgi:outer membrane scaffolding protein for murein synthesis (MipA/OmpV family)
MRHVVRIAAFAAWFAGAAVAQDAPPAAPIDGAGGEDIVLELGAGGMVAPAYEGADEYLFTPYPIVLLHYLRLPVLGDFGGGPEAGLSIGPSFRFVPGRDEDDHSHLDGIGDVSPAYEFGATIGYRTGMWRGFVTLRQGFGGHHGLIGEVGVDAIVEPTPRLTVNFGPRIGFAGSDYLDTYLGVSPDQGAASGLPEFDPDGGIKGVGLEAEARYALTRNWSLLGKAGYERLVGDAADSPVTDLGSANQLTAGIGFSYRFGLGLFD